MPQLRIIWELSLNWAIVFFKLVCGLVYGRLFWSLVDVGIALLGAVSFLVRGPELHRRGESKVGAEASNTDTFISLCSWLWMGTEEPLESWSSFSPQWWAIIWNWKPYKYFSSSKLPLVSMFYPSNRDEPPHPHPRDIGLLKNITSRD